MQSNTVTKRFDVVVALVGTEPGGDVKFSPKSDEKKRHLVLLGHGNFKRRPGTVQDLIRCVPLPANTAI